MKDIKTYYRIVDAVSLNPFRGVVCPLVYTVSAAVREVSG
jgi:hypothetical protein